MSTWDDIRRNAKTQTEDTFASQISSLTSLKDGEINEIAPTSEDKDKLAHLLSIVNDAATNNNAKADAIRNVNGLLEIAIPLLTKLL